MPSRTAMILSKGRRNNRGDPIFGFLAKLAIRGGRAIAGRLGSRGGAVTAARTAVGKIATIAGTRTGRVLAGAAGLGATVGAAALGTSLVNGAGPNGEVLIDPRTGLPFKKRRRINPLNPRAARRAVRRLCQLQHFTDRLEHSLSHIGRHHHHPVHHRVARRKK